MPENISNLKNEIAKLQKRHDNALLDLKKIKLDAQEERLKYERWMFKMEQKIIEFDSILDKIKHKITFSRAEYDDACKKRDDARKTLQALQEIKEERDRRKKGSTNLKDQS